MIVGVAALVAATLVKPAVRIVYNPSDSAPRGWYIVLPADHSRVVDCVLPQLTSAVAMLAARRA